MVNVTLADEVVQADLNVIRVQYNRPYLYPKQENIMFHKNVDGTSTRFVCCEASTKSGKTHGCIVYIIERALFGKENQNCWWVAPTYRTSKIAFRRVKFALRKMIKQGKATVNDTELWVQINGAATIWFLTGEKPDNLYGEDVIACVIDEASRVRPESWTAIYSTLTATDGECRLIGNVVDRHNFFYVLSRKAENGRVNWAYDMITVIDAVAAGVIKQRVLDEAKSGDITEQDFNALYMCIPPDDGGNPFGEAYIEKCLRPLSKKEPVCWGVDLAKSGDFTWMIALDEDCNVCRLEKYQHDWTITKSIIPSRVNGAPTLIDSTGVGDPIVEDLSNDNPNIEGFKFTVQSKQQLMEGLAYAVQNGIIGFPEGELPQQMRTMTYEHTRLHVLYVVPEGLHDDAIMALGLALLSFGTQTFSWTITDEEKAIYNTVHQMSA